jgi:hypothetical protein
MGSEAYCVLDLNFLKVRKRPGSIEVAIGRLVESKIRKPVFARDGWNPVVLEAGRRFRSAIDVHRAILVFAQVHARGAIGNLLLDFLKSFTISWRSASGATRSLGLCRAYRKMAVIQRCGHRCLVPC